MAWEKHFVKVNPEKSIQRALKKSQEGYLNSQKAGGLGSKFSSYLPEVYAGHPNRIERYAQYDDMDRDPEINVALNIIADFCTQIEERNDRRILDFRFKSEPTEQEVQALKLTLEKWIDKNDFNRTLWYIVRYTIMYGDQFFVRDPETYEWIWLDHRKVQSVWVDESQGKKPQAYVVSDLDLNLRARLGTGSQDPNATHSPFSSTNVSALPHSASPYSKGPNNSRFQTQPNQEVIDAKHIVHISLNVGLDANWPFGTSILEPIYKTFKQKELLEDAMIIYRVQRAPERRVFYVDVGNMPQHKASMYLERIKNEIHQRRIPTKSGGGTSISDAVYNPLSIMEDFFFAQSSEGRGSKVETLPGGEGIANIDDLKYFNNKLIRGLGVPANYISTGPEDQQSAYTDGRTGSGLQQEIKFTRYCMRLQAIVAKVLDREFKKFLKDSGLEIEDSLFEIQFNPPQNFTQYAQIERDAAQIQVFQPLSELKFFSKRFLMKRFLNLTEEEIEENIRMWKEENAKKVKDHTGLAPDEMEGGNSISAMGVRADAGIPGEMGDADLEGEMEGDGEGGDLSGDTSPLGGGDAGDDESPL